jgi:hypothetical protein
LEAVSTEAELVTDEAVERLAWYLFIERDDMGHEPTAVQARLVWENPRHKARQAATDRARRYLEVAAGQLHAGRID